MSFEEIASKQLSSSCIVGMATRNQGYYYKKAMYEQIKPDILVLGSSRTMQFREEFFSKSLYNAGGAMNHINEGFSFVREIFHTHVPKIIILGLDYWWFNENVNLPVKVIKPPLKPSSRISMRSYLLPYQWLFQGKITFYEYFKRINPLLFLKEDGVGIGVDAILNNNGFLPDGSYLYTKITSGKEKNIDENFNHILNSIHHHYPLFQSEANINSIHFQNFLAMLDYIKKYNIKVFIFIPPLAPDINEKLGHFSFVEKLKTHLDFANVKYYDFHNPNRLQASNCEFIDGIHGGDLLYAKILYHLSQREKELHTFVNPHYLAEVVQTFHHIAMIPRKKSLQNLEVDFLKIGCDKSSQLAEFNISSEKKIRT